MQDYKPRKFPAPFTIKQEIFESKPSPNYFMENQVHNNDNVTSTNSESESLDAEDLTQQSSTNNNSKSRLIFIV